MPNYNIDEDLLSDIESGAQSSWAEHSAYDADTERYNIDTEAISNQEIAYLSQNPDYLAGILGDLGIEDPSEYTQFIAGYDPWKQDIALKKWDLNRSNLFSTTRKNLLDNLGDPMISAGISGKMNVEGVGEASGGYLKSLENIDVEGVEQDFADSLQANTLQRDETIEAAFQDYSDYVYREAGDIYSHQQQAKSGGGKK